MVLYLENIFGEKSQLTQYIVQAMYSLNQSKETQNIVIHYTNTIYW